MDINIELWQAFDDIFFEEDVHRYTDSVGTKYTSVTTFVGQFESDKDWDLIAEKCLKKPENFGKTVESLRAEWKAKGDYACVLGTAVHSVMEYAWAKKDFKPDPKIFEQYEGMEEDFTWRKQKANELFKKLKEIYVPIRNEFIVYDRDWKLCGTIDFLCLNKVTGKMAILDWKTSKKFDQHNRYQKMKTPFETEDDCNCTHYSLQLSTYKAILEKHTSLKIDELTLIQIPSKEVKTAEIYKCKDFSDKIKKYMDSL